MRSAALLDTCFIAAAVCAFINSENLSLEATAPSRASSLRSANPPPLHFRVEDFQRVFDVFGGHIERAVFSAESRSCIAGDDSAQTLYFPCPSPLPFILCHSRV